MNPQAQPPSVSSSRPRDVFEFLADRHLPAVPEILVVTASVELLRNCIMRFDNLPRTAPDNDFVTQAWAAKKASGAGDRPTGPPPTAVPDLTTPPRQVVRDIARWFGMPEHAVIYAAIRWMQTYSLLRFDPARPSEVHFPTELERLVRELQARYGARGRQLTDDGLWVTWASHQTIRDQSFRRELDAALIRMQAGAGSMPFVTHAGVLLTGEPVLQLHHGSQPYTAVFHEKKLDPAAMAETLAVWSIDLAESETGVGRVDGLTMTPYEFRMDPAFFR